MRTSVIVLLLMAATTPVFAGGTYKWVDEHGVTHYGDRIPPEYNNHGSQQLNKRGIVIKTTQPALTDEQRKTIAEEKLARELQEKKASEQKRQDDALLLTYTSIEEIEQKREREAQQAELAISNLETQRKSAVAQLNEQLKLKATHGDKPIPEHLAFDIANSEQRIARLEEQLSSKRHHLSEIQSRYEAHKKRFAELKAR
jgi:hypothetical protein